MERVKNWFKKNLGKSTDFSTDLTSPIQKQDLLDLVANTNTLDETPSDMLQSFVLGTATEVLQHILDEEKNDPPVISS